GRIDYLNSRNIRALTTIGTHIEDWGEESRRAEAEPLLLSPAFRDLPGFDPPSGHRASSGITVTHVGFASEPPTPFSATAGRNPSGSNWAWSAMHVASSSATRIRGTAMSVSPKPPPTLTDQLGVSPCGIPVVPSCAAQHRTLQLS